MIFFRSFRDMKDRELMMAAVSLRSQSEQNEACRLLADEAEAERERRLLAANPYEEETSGGTNRFPREDQEHALRAAADE